MCLWPDQSPLLSKHRALHLAEGAPSREGVCPQSHLRLGVRNKFHRWSLQHLISELFSWDIAFPLTSLVTLR